MAYASGLMPDPEESKWAIPVLYENFFPGLTFLYFHTTIEGVKTWDERLSFSVKLNIPNINNEAIHYIYSHLGNSPDPATLNLSA